MCAVPPRILGIYLQKSMPEKKAPKLESKAAIEAFITGAAATLALTALAKRLARDERLQGMDWEDILQETKLKMWRAADRFEGRSLLETWGHRIMVNVVNDATGKYGKIRKAVLDDPVATLADRPSVDYNADPETATLRQEELERILGELNQLSTAEREVIFRTIFADQTPTSISEETGMKLGTVKSHKHRGEAKLRIARDDNPEAA